MNSYSHRYRAFGDYISKGVSVNQPRRFTGHTYDEDGGLNWSYCGARYYDAVLGRFTQIDPLRNKYPVWAPYAYALDNPMTMVDPNGKETANNREVAYAIKHPYNAFVAHGNASAAKRSTFPSEQKNVGATDNNYDAQRHALWSAMNARDLGVNAAVEIGENHEAVDNNPAESMEMDLANNDVGITIGAQNPNASNEELAALVAQAESEGMLQTTPKTGPRDKAEDDKLKARINSPSYDKQRQTPERVMPTVEL